MRKDIHIKNYCLMYKYEHKKEEWCHIEKEVRTGLQRCR